MTTAFSKIKIIGGDSGGNVKKIGKNF